MKFPDSFENMSLTEGEFKSRLNKDQIKLSLKLIQVWL